MHSTLIRDQDKTQESQKRMAVEHPKNISISFAQFNDFLKKAIINYEDKIKNEDIPDFDKDTIYVKPKVEIGRISTEKKVSNVFGDNEKITFDLVYMSDGSTVQVNFSKKDDDINQHNCYTVYTVDMEKFGDPNDPNNVEGREKAKLALRAFCQLVMEAELSYQPHNSTMHIKSSGSTAWEEIHRQVTFEYFQNNIHRFEEKGIKPVFNGTKITSEMISAAKIDQEETLLDEDKKINKSKPWDIPKAKPTKS